MTARGEADSEQLLAAKACLQVQALLNQRKSVRFWVPVACTLAQVKARLCATLSLAPNVLSDCLFRLEGDSLFFIEDDLDLSDAIEHLFRLAAFSTEAAEKREKCSKPKAKGSRQPMLKLSVSLPRMALITERPLAGELVVPWFAGDMSATVRLVSSDLEYTSERIRVHFADRRELIEAICHLLAVHCVERAAAHTFLEHCCDDCNPRDPSGLLAVDDSIDLTALTSIHNAITDTPFQLRVVLPIVLRSDANVSGTLTALLKASSASPPPPPYIPWPVHGSDAPVDADETDDKKEEVIRGVETAAVSTVAYKSCTVCNVECMERGEWKTHSASKAHRCNASTYFFCFPCGERMKVWEKDTHMKQVSHKRNAERNYYCKYCQLIYARKEYLEHCSTRMHMSRMSTSDSRALVNKMCRLCYLFFATRRQWFEHWAAVHRKTKDSTLAYSEPQSGGSVPTPSGGKRSAAKSGALEEWTATELRGRVLSLARHKTGSDYLVAQLSDAAFLAVIFEEVLALLDSVMMDKCGHSVVRAMVAHCSDEQLLRLVKALQPCLSRVSCCKHGSMAIQSLMERLHTAEQMKALLAALRKDMANVMLHPAGHWIILKLLNCFPCHYASAVVDCLVQNLAKVVRQQFGCKVLRVCIDTLETAVLTGAGVVDKRHSFTTDAKHRAADSRRTEVKQRTYSKQRFKRNPFYEISSEQYYSARRIYEANIQAQREGRESAEDYSASGARDTESEYESDEMQTEGVATRRPLECKTRLVKVADIEESGIADSSCIVDGSGIVDMKESDEEELSSRSIDLSSDSDDEFEGGGDMSITMKSAASGGRKRVDVCGERIDGTVMARSMMYQLYSAVIRNGCQIMEGQSGSHLVQRVLDCGVESLSEAMRRQMRGQYSHLAKCSRYSAHIVQKCLRKCHEVYVAEQLRERAEASARAALFYGGSEVAAISKAPRSNPLKERSAEWIRAIVTELLSNCHELIRDCVGNHTLQVALEVSSIDKNLEFLLRRMCKLNLCTLPKHLQTKWACLLAEVRVATDAQDSGQGYYGYF